DTAGTSDSVRTAERGGTCSPRCSASVYSSAFSTGVRATSGSLRCCMGCGHSTCLESASSRAAGDALERLAVELKRTRMDLGAWKWAIVLAHNASPIVLADAAGSHCRKDSKETVRALSQARLAGGRQ